MKTRQMLDQLGITAKKHKVAATACLLCGQQADGASDVANTDEAPSEGDISVCLYCGNVAAFDKELKLRAATPEELATLDDEQKAQIDKVVRHAKARRAWRN